MDNNNIIKILDNNNRIIDSYYNNLDIYTYNLRDDLRSFSGVLYDDVEIRLSNIEIIISDHTAYISYSASYHFTKALVDPDPGLIAVIVTVWKVVKTVLEIINIISQFLKIVTGHNLTYYIDQLIPGFEETWNDIMKNVSVISGMIGWGVDGVLHLMNAINIGSSITGTVLGKNSDWFKIDKANKLGRVLESLGNRAERWQNNPGQVLSSFFEQESTWDFLDSENGMAKTFKAIKDVTDKSEKIATDTSSLTKELSAIRNDMPAFIANNIPQKIWNTLTAIDTKISQDILPVLRKYDDKLKEIDAVLESHRKKSKELADKIARPGDMMAEIKNLPDYARKDQLSKIDDINSISAHEANQAEYAAMTARLKESSRIHEALSQTPASLNFMTLEVPGRSPGIVAEPRETWFVGDY